MSQNIFSMPLQFASKSDYTKKLQELLVMEAECERLSIESIAAKNVSFNFMERLEIYSKLQLWIPKDFQAYIR